MLASKLLPVCMAIVLLACGRQEQLRNPLPPLIDAIAGRDTEVVRSLLAAGADPNQKLSNGDTALAFAVRAHENVPERQIRKLQGLQGPPEEDTTILELLLEYGADPNIETTSFGSPLMIAVYQGLTQSTAVLLESGADPNYHSDGGGTPLMVAAFHCYADIAELLMRYGATIAYEDSYGRTAMSEAELEDCPEVVELLTRK